MPAPPHVASGELIQSAWGNLVVDALGAQAFAAAGSPSIPGGTLQQVAFASTSSAAWGTGPTFIAPAGIFGWYAVQANAQGPTMGAGMESDLYIRVTKVGGTVVEFHNFIPAGKSRITTIGIADVATGDQVGVWIYNPTGTAAFFNTNLAIARVGI